MAVTNCQAGNCGSGKLQFRIHQPVILAALRTNYVTTRAFLYESGSVAMTFWVAYRKGSFLLKEAFEDFDGANQRAGELFDMRCDPVLLDPEGGHLHKRMLERALEITPCNRASPDLTA